MSSDGDEVEGMLAHLAEFTSDAEQKLTLRQENVFCPPPLCCIVDGTVRCVKKTFSALRRYVASPQRAAAPLYEVRKEGLQYWQGENSECAPRGGMAPIGRRGGQPARSATTGVNLITPLAGALQKYAIL